ncbi:hypothetical protein [Bradyrhizobium sp.]|uniref:hypothetical protein n=1 Tax=Bradyrhizobium sp. TaxID=376 RepID=UPI003C4B4E8C
MRSAGIAKREENYWINWPILLYRTMIAWNPKGFAQILKTGPTAQAKPLMAQKKPNRGMSERWMKL